MVWGPCLRVITGQTKATGLNNPVQLATPLLIEQSVTVTELPDVTLAVVVPAIAVVTEDFWDA